MSTLNGNKPIPLSYLAGGACVSKKLSPLWILVSSVSEGTLQAKGKETWTATQLQNLQSVLPIRCSGAVTVQNLWEVNEYPI